MIVRQCRIRFSYAMFRRLYASKRIQTRSISLVTFWATFSGVGVRSDNSSSFSNRTPRFMLSLMIWKYQNKTVHDDKIEWNRIFRIQIQVCCLDWFHPQICSDINFITSVRVTAKINAEAASIAWERAASFSQWIIACLVWDVRCLSFCNGLLCLSQNFLSNLVAKASVAEQPELMHVFTTTHTVQWLLSTNCFSYAVSTHSHFISIVRVI